MIEIVRRELCPACEGLGMVPMSSQTDVAFNAFAECLVCDGKVTVSLVLASFADAAALFEAIEGIVLDRDTAPGNAAYHVLAALGVE